MPDQSQPDGQPPVDPAQQPPTPPGAQPPVPHQPTPETAETRAAAAERQATPLVPHPGHPHDPGNAFGGQVANDAVSARRIAAALVRMDAARKRMEALVPPAEVEAFEVPDADAAAALVEYLGARDQMNDAMRAFGPPR